MLSSGKDQLWLKQNANVMFFIHVSIVNGYIVLCFTLDLL